jgi:hypothetical protein
LDEESGLRLPTVSRTLGHRLLVLQRFFQNYQQLQGKQVQVQDSKLDQAAVNVIARALTSYNALREQLREEHHGSGGS